MVKKFLSTLCISASLMFSSCEYDYDIDKYFDDNHTPQVVLNSIISPDSVINGCLFWTRQIDSKEDFKIVDSFYVKLYQEDKLIFEAQCAEGKFNSAIYPKVGLNYKLEVDIPNYGAIKASTMIPMPAKFKASYIETRGEYVCYDHVSIDEITTAQKSRSVWITGGYNYSDEKYNNSCKYLYTYNSFIDQDNTSQDDTDVAYRGSNVGYEYFIRVPYKNISESTPSSFSTWAGYDISEEALVGEDFFGNPIYGEIVVTFESTTILLITPSDDYDKYYKSLYLQQGHISASIFQKVVSVYSNIENGRGVFAGFSADKYDFKRTTE